MCMYIYMCVCVVLKGLRHPCVVLCECRQAGVLAAEAVVLHTACAARDAGAVGCIIWSTEPILDLSLAVF